MNPVVHFEMPYQNRDRAADFYSKAFGWNANKLGPEMGDYMVMHTAETDENNMVKTPGAINGGMFKKSADGSAGVSVVINVEDIRAALKAVTDAGGQALGGRMGNGEPDEIPGVGLYASIIDTEGNRVGLMQPVKR
jgi:predicted enzyme related to lactoylglutathione lyase